MALRIAICDDEPLAVERLADMLARIDDVALAGTAGDGRAAIDLIAATRPDAVLLDIEMPRLDGFDVVDALARDEAMAGAPPLIVFVTACPKFAAHAFDTGALDFLTKPVRLVRLEAAVERIRQAVADRSALVRLEELARQLEALRAERGGSSAADSHIWVQRRGELVRVDLASIDWIRAEGEYVRLHCGETSYLHRDLISEMGARLDPAAFLRVHRSIIVNRGRIASLRRQAHGALRLVLQDGEDLPVGRKYRADVRDALNF